MQISLCCFTAPSKRETQMTNKIQNIAKLCRDRRGVTAMEYGIIAALIAVVLVGGVATFGTGLTTMFSNISTAMTSGS
jgi:pilus assembly protein Flp/PilA